MTCSQCQRENPKGARFCNACGAQLELPCPQCTHLNPPGSVTMWYFSILNIRVKLATVDEQADDEIVHLHGLRETECSSGEALNARPQRQMLAFQLLRIAFPHFMASTSKMALVRPPALGVKTLDPEGHEQCLQLLKCVIFPPPKHIR